MKEIKTGQGFTLAEVLITLAIIGIVAALTIPTLMANYQKATYITGLKRAYSEFNQALLQMSTDKGCPGDLKCSGVFSTTTENAGSDISKQFKLAKDCGTKADMGCFSKDVSNYFMYTADRWSYDGAGYYKFIAADNISYRIFSIGDNCSTNYNYGSIANHVSQVCGQVDIDTNGPNKGPNIFGRDIFEFMISNGKGPLLYPVGGSEDAASGYWKDAWQCLIDVPQGTDNGMYCAGRVMEEGWQMNY